MHRLFGAAVLTGTLVCATTASAQTSYPRAWLDVNFGVAQTAKSDLDSEFHFTIFAEQATLKTVYTQGNGTMFDVGGGFMLKKKFGVGVSLSSSSHDDDVVMSASIPHPLFFNQNAFDDATTSVSGSERSINISAVWVAMDSGKMRIRIFGGPSFVMVKQNVIQDFNTATNLNGTTWTVTVSPDNPVTNEISETLTGIHIGGDFSYFFSKVFGVGGVVRYIATGTKDVFDPFGEGTNTIGIKGGGVQVGGGVRLRF